MNLQTIHWTALKRMVEEKGGTWENKEQAIAFLLGTAPTPVVADVSADGFDKSQPYGVISGDFEEMPGARFVQNGKYYTAAGVKVG